VIDNKKVRYYIFSIILFILSFGGKEQAVTFPVWLLMLYWLLGYSLKDRKVWIQTIPFFLLSVLFGVISMLANASGGLGALSGETTYPLWQRFIFGCYSLFEYLTKFVFPFKLLYLYPFPTMIGEPLHEWLLMYPALTAIIVVTLWKYFLKTPVLTGGLVFFLIHIVIVLHVVPLARFAVVADRYIYLASIGGCFIIAWYAVHFLQQWKNRRKTGLYITLLFYVFYLGIYSNLRSRVWHDSDSLKKEIKELLKDNKKDDTAICEFEADFINTLKK